MKKVLVMISFVLLMTLGIVSCEKNEANNKLTDLTNNEEQQSDNNENVQEDNNKKIRKK